MKKIVYSVVVNLFICNSFLLAGSILNSGFEIGDPNYIACWDTENIALRVDNFVPIDWPGEKVNWKISQTEALNPYEGNGFALLSNGGFDINYGKMSQVITVEAGDKISGAYFFGACDYRPFNDYASIKLIAEPGSGLSDIELVYISIEEVGDYSSTDGWVTFQSESFTADNCGTYTLECSVFDFWADNMLESYFAVDGLKIIPEPASIMMLLAGIFFIRRK